jgi:hypothetical protein
VWWSVMFSAREDASAAHSISMSALHSHGPADHAGCCIARLRSTIAPTPPLAHPNEHNLLLLLLSLFAAATPRDAVRPGATPGLNPASIQYSVAQPSSAPTLGQPLAISVARKEGVPLFDTTGHRCAGCAWSILPAECF